MTVERIVTKEIVDNSKQEPESSSNSKNIQVLSVFKAIGIVLAVRFFLFLSLLGSFVLSLIAIYDKNLASLLVLIAYSLLTTGPLVLLEWKGKKNGG